MKNYWVVDSCLNCHHVFVKSEYEEGHEYFCNKNKDRPKRCGSVCMHECFMDLDNDLEWDREAEKDWNQWAYEHRVASNGRCDDYRGKNNDTK